MNVLIPGLPMAYVIWARTQVSGPGSCIPSFTVRSTLRSQVAMILCMWQSCIYSGTGSSRSGLESASGLMVLFIPMLFEIIHCCELGIRIFIINLFHWMLLRISRYLLRDHLLRSSISVLDRSQCIFESPIWVNLLIKSLEHRVRFIQQWSIVPPSKCGMRDLRHLCPLSFQFLTVNIIFHFLLRRWHIVASWLFHLLNICPNGLQQRLFLIRLAFNGRLELVKLQLFLLYVNASFMRIHPLISMSEQLVMLWCLRITSYFISQRLWWISGSVTDCESCAFLIERFKQDITSQAICAPNSYFGLPRALSSNRINLRPRIDDMGMLE